MKKLVKISIREFALPCPRSGSIEANSGFSRATLEGIEIHQRVQQKRKKEFSNYESEVKLSREFERDGFVFLVEGRMDGLFAATASGSGAAPKIEEIKSSFNIEELQRTLIARPLTHPYCLQLLTYGYFYQLQENISPELSFHLVSTRNNETIDYDIQLDIGEYEAWLEIRLQELVEVAKRAEKRTARRRKISEKFEFPFPRPRPGQLELVASIENGMRDKKRMFIQAPTGLGKTVGVLYPALKEALMRGQRVVYITPKNSQHSVAEDAVERLQEKGAALKSLTITAKSKICMKAEPLCNPQYCEYARDYYDKVAEHDLIATLAKKKKISARTFKKAAEEFEVCPFELQLDVAEEADALICDYNYVLAPQSALNRVSQSAFAVEGKPNLVIDEAHNVPSRAMQFYSPALSTFALEKMREDFHYLPKRFAKEAEELLDECIKVVQDCAPPGVGSGKGSEIDPPTEPFVEQDAKLRGFLSRYLDSDIEIQPKDPILNLCFYWSGFSEMLFEISGQGRPEFFTTFQPDRYAARTGGEKAGGTIKITCCDASEMLKPRYDEFDQVVAFSATLKPFDYYARLSGLESPDLQISEFQSPFDKAKRKLLIIPQISTKFSDRERNYAKIAETITKIAALRPGNHLAFFPSFDFLERVLQVFKVPPGFMILKQERHMKNSDVERTLEHLKSEAAPTILFAVQGGVFSEGVDYPGNMVVGAFVIGPPLPNFDIERESMRKYYEEHYQEGFDYAYAYPAMAKAVQAAGRVIRSEQDRGVIVLMDGRFLDRSYTKSMPSDWFKESARELVSSSILKDVGEFWSS